MNIVKDERTENRKRPVKFKLNKWEGSTVIEYVEHEGIFHRFGEKFHDDIYEGQETIGIIEDPSGQLHAVPIHLIKFTDKK